MSVHEYGRGLFLVDSNTRMLKDRNGWPIYDEHGVAIPMRHLVDFEPELDNQGKPEPKGEPYRCSCESFALRLDRPCRHCIEVLEYLDPILKHLKKWKPPEAPSESPKRTYQLKRHVTTETNTHQSKRRLPARLPRQPA